MTVETAAQRAAQKTAKRWLGWRTWLYAWRLAIYRPDSFFGMLGVELYIFAIAHLVTGALTRLFFDALTGTSAWRPLGTEIGVWGILALLAGNSLFRS